jgi:hypothetical protein
MSKKISWNAGRRRAWSSMPPSTQDVALKLEADLCRLNRRETLICYDLGQRVQEVLSSPATFGGNGVAQLAQYLGIKGGADELVQAWKVTTIFPRAFVAEQSSQPTTGGHFLSFRHFIELAGIGSEEMRSEVLRIVREYDLSVAQLRRLIEEMPE